MTRFQRRRIWIFGVTVILLLSASFWLLNIRDLIIGTHDYSKPWPPFSSLAESPDTTLRGSIAYISGPGAPEHLDPGNTKELTKRSCAFVVSASGADAKKVYCWPMIERELASVVWMSDGQLRITGFEDVPKGRPQPVWGTVVSLSTGELRDVPIAELGIGAFPVPPSTTNAAGETLIVKNGEGSARVTIENSDGTREVFSVTNQNAGFSIVGDPQWSSDGSWFVMYDGQRLLTTTTDATPITRVLAVNVSGAIGEWGATTFSMTDREW